MRIRLLLYFLAGLAVVLLAVALILRSQRGGHMELTGSILKVRTLSTDENSSVALIDFRASNTADYPWMVRSVTVSTTLGEGGPVEGSTVSDVDVARLFQYFPLLGPKYNDSLTTRMRIPPHQSVDRMIAARFEISEARLRARKGLLIRVEEVDGAVSEIVEDLKK